MGPFIITIVLGHFIGPWIINILRVFKYLDNIGLKTIVKTFKKHNSTWRVDTFCDRIKTATNGYPG